MEVIIERRGRHKRRLWRLFRLYFRLLLLFLIFSSTCAIILLSYTKWQGAPSLHVPKATIFYGVDHSEIGERHYGERRYWVDLANISPHVVQATLSIEDRRFYTHYGFDINRIGGAVIANIKTNTRAQGASTITQQYARNLYLSHDKTWKRKWHELLYALQLEMNYEKDEILEGYLNTVYYGHGAYGIEAAAYHYFNKSAKSLTIAEASMLAGIPKGPKYYSPLLNYERAKQRQHVVLQAMVENDVLSKSAAKKAAEQQLIFSTHVEDEPLLTGAYFQDAVEKQLFERGELDERTLQEGGLHVYTTLDPSLQKIAEHWIQKEMPHSSLQVALVAMDPRTGDVKALVGGKNYEESPYNRAIQGKRAPGSAFKPFLYYSALESGFTAATPLLSEATTFTYDDGRATYSPSNYENMYADDFITLLQAIAFSDNIYAVKTHLLIGTDKIIDTAQKVGIESTLSDIPSLALGTMPVNVLEMVGAYSPFANGGSRVQPRFIERVIDANGELIYESEPELTEVLDPVLSFILTDLLQAMFEPNLNAHANVTGGSIAHIVNRPVAGKSGSTTTDSWMIGYTPQLVIGVWVGHDKGKTINQQTEGQIAKRIWANVMEQAHENKLKLPFQRPDGIVAVDIDPTSGLLATEDCAPGRTTYFVPGTEPTKQCPTPHVEKETEQIDEAKKEEEKFFQKIFKWFKVS